MSYRVHKLFLPYLALVENPKIRSCDLDLLPMTLKINRFRAVVKIRGTAKFHRAAVHEFFLRTENKETLT